MTINKTQGQTLTKCGVLLDEPVFTHGQLYVAALRCGSPQNIRFFVNNFQTVNVVYKEVLYVNKYSVACNTTRGRLFCFNVF